MSVDLEKIRNSLGQYYLATNEGYTYVKYQQERIIPLLEKVERGEILRLAIFMPPGHAKGFAEQIPVFTGRGWLEYGSLQVGDTVFGVNGAPTSVTALSRKFSANCKVTFTDGSTLFATDEHEWPVFDRTRGEWRTLETKYFLAETKFRKPRVLRSAERYIYQLPNRGPISLPERTLELHPYVLGVWLGDGTTAAPSVTGAAGDRQIISKIEARGYEISSIQIHPQTGVIRTNFAGRLRRELKALGLIGKTKRIPDVYKHSSITQRLELLAGLIDTDGHVDQAGKIRIATVSKILADDIAEVVKWLGWHACIYKGQPGTLGHQPCYYVGFQPTMDIPTVLPRKRIPRLAPQRRDLAIAEVERTDYPKKGRCIQVANPDGLYLVGENFIPTHNSDIATRTFAPWYQGKHPKENVMVTSYAADLASDDFGAKIKERFNSDVHLAVFPESRLTRDSHAKTHFNTISGGTFYSVGFKGGITGKRLNLLVMDDLIKSPADADSEPVQNVLFETYKGVTKDRMRPQGKMVMCMHRWRPRDVAGRILEWDGTADQGGQWTVLKVPAEDPPGSGKYLWVEHYGKKHYEDIKRDDETWFPKFQQEPAGGSSYWFADRWLNYYDIAPPPGKFNTYLIVDPAGKPSKKTDFTSMHVWAAGQDEKLLLVDWVLDKLDPGERVSMIMALVRKWRPQQVIYEEYGLVSDTYYITEKMKEAKMEERFYPIPVGKKGPRHNLSKNERIKGIIPFFRENRIFLPRKFMYQQRYSKKTLDLTERFVKNEYGLFKGEGSIAHEDDLDNMSRLLEPELVINYFTQPDEDDEGKYRESECGWEGRY